MMLAVIQHLVSVQMIASLGGDVACLAGGITVEVLPRLAWRLCREKSTLGNRIPPATQASGVVKQFILSLKLERDLKEFALLFGKSRGPRLPWCVQS